MISQKYFRQFLHRLPSSGTLMIFCVAVSLVIANSPLATFFQKILDVEIGSEIFQLNFPVSSWINDGLMAVFFLLVGLEIKQEFVQGELHGFKKAALPIVAALGGMMVPALIFYLFNHETGAMNGWAIPIATDIAFSLAIISMLGKRVPISLKVFLAALAIVDDLGAILVIAIFYTEHIQWSFIVGATLLTIALFALNYCKVKKLIFYIIPGLFLWYFMHHSGIHATIAGVVLALTIPMKSSPESVSPLKKLEHQLHLPVHFFILPVFALANTNITFTDTMFAGLISPFSLGIIGGLFLGKVIGICLFSWILIRLRICSLPDQSSWVQMLGVGLLAGIGFTMSIFIALLSFPGCAEIQNQSKIAVLVASLFSGFSGYLLLKFAGKKSLSINSK
ncbi:MAG: Na+/H+ antiporter NhaA [Chryseobacterium sp. 39-10]|nr:Na+/H+ antiporter NhaA [Chryseobacterium sp.]OJV47737.1 MAG: Na+/H+ antiporter NhaA [Chryseobacterium sp. 39-10]